jgi:hypothetical protein
MAKLSGRKRVTCVHKANIQKITDGLFLRSFQEVAADYPQLQHDDILIDNLCMQLVTKPEQFDVLLLPNLFGDIASDLCAGLVGGLGVAPGGNIGQDSAVFEAVHGSAPDIAGKGLANPTAILLSGLQMLRYLGLNGYAKRIEDALQQTLEAGIKTGDLGGKASTQEFTDAICSRIAPEDTVSGQETPTKIIIAREPLTKEQQDWNIHGIDVFVRSKTGSIPVLPETIGSFKLAMISNRGTKIYPGNAPDILMVDHYRCRFYAQQPVQREDIISMLTAFPKDYPWMHVEILHNEGDTPLFSKAQGE